MSDRRITILRAALEDDGLSKSPGAFEAIGGRWAGKTDISDGERIAAAAQGVDLTARFLLRWDKLTSTIANTDRLSCDGRTYQVVGAKEVLGRRIAIEITAKALP